MLVPCPTCGSASKIYTSRRVTDHGRELFMRCMIKECDTTFRVMAETLNVIIPSALPDDDHRRLQGARPLRVARKRPSRKADEAPPTDPAPMTEVIHSSPGFHGETDPRGAVFTRIRHVSE